MFGRYQLPFLCLFRVIELVREVVKYVPLTERFKGVFERKTYYVTFDTCRRKRRLNSFGYFDGKGESSVHELHVVLS